MTDEQRKDLWKAIEDDERIMEEEMDEFNEMLVSNRSSHNYTQERF